MPDREDNKPDVSQSAVRAVEEIGGIEPLEDGAELIGDAETRRKYREAMAKERERQFQTTKSQAS